MKLEEIAAKRKSKAVRTKKAPHRRLFFSGLLRKPIAALEFLRAAQVRDAHILICMLAPLREFPPCSCGARVQGGASAGCAGSATRPATPGTSRQMNTWAAVRRDSRLNIRRVAWVRDARVADCCARGDAAAGVNSWDLARRGRDWPDFHYNQGHRG